jgi:hypothetical protein
MIGEQCMASPPTQPLQYVHKFSRLAKVDTDSTGVIKISQYKDSRLCKDWSRANF